MNNNDFTRLISIDLLNDVESLAAKVKATTPLVGKLAEHSVDKKTPLSKTSFAKFKDLAKEAFSHPEGLDSSTKALTQKIYTSINKARGHIESIHTEIEGRTILDRLRNQKPSKEFLLKRQSELEHAFLTSLTIDIQLTGTEGTQKIQEANQRLQESLIKTTLETARAAGEGADAVEQSKSIKNEKKEPFSRDATLENLLKLSVICKDNQPLCRLLLTKIQARIDALSTEVESATPGWISESEHKAQWNSLADYLKEFTSNSELIQPLVDKSSQFEKDTDYRNKKIGQNLFLLQPLVPENVDVQKLWPKLESYGANALIETIIKAHLKPGKEKLSAPLAYSEYSLLIALFDPTKNVKEIKALQQAREATGQKPMLSELLGPNQHMAPYLEAVLTDILQQPDMAKGFNEILKAAITTKQKITVAIQNKEPMTIKNDLLFKFIDVCEPIYASDPEPEIIDALNQIQLLVIATAGEAPNTQLVTDSMLLALYAKEELTGTESRFVLGLEDAQAQKNAGKLNHLDTYLVDNGYLYEKKTYNLWYKNTWKVEHPGQGDASDKLTVINWEGSLVIPAGDLAIRKKTNSASLDLQELGPLSLEEQRQAFRFAHSFCTSQEIRIEAQNAITKQDPSLIPVLTANNHAFLQEFLLNDPSYWKDIKASASDKALLSQERHDELLTQSIHVLDRYQKLLAATQTFTGDMERGFTQALMDVGADDADVVYVP